MPDEPTDKPDPAQAFQSRLDKMSGDANALARMLFDENYRLREKGREIDKLMKELEAKVPADDHVVLSPAKAQEYEAYKAIGKPQEIQDRLDAHSGLETKVKELEQKDILREVADLHNYKLSVLLDRDKAAGGLKIEIKDDGKGNKVAHVKDGDKDTPITEFAQANWADYLPSLKVETAPQPRAGNGYDPKPKVNTAPSVADLKAQKLRSGQYYSS